MIWFYIWKICKIFCTQGHSYFLKDYGEIDLGIASPIQKFIIDLTQSIFTLWSFIFSLEALTWRSVRRNCCFRRTFVVVHFLMDPHFMKSHDQSGDRDTTDWIPLIRIAPFTGGIATLLSLSSLESVWSTMTLSLIIQWRIATIYRRLLRPNDPLWLIFKDYIRSVVVDPLTPICPMTEIPLADLRIATLLSMQSYDTKPMNNQEIDIFIVVAGILCTSMTGTISMTGSLSPVEKSPHFCFSIVVA